MLSLQSHFINKITDVRIIEVEGERWSSLNLWPERTGLPKLPCPVSEFPVIFGKEEYINMSLNSLNRT